MLLTFTFFRRIVVPKPVSLNLSEAQDLIRQLLVQSHCKRSFCSQVFKVRTAHRSAAVERAEKRIHKAVDVVKRQGVKNRVAGGPLPRVDEHACLQIRA